jgi:hypothetical protein
MLYGEIKTKREPPTVKKKQALKDLNTKHSGGKFNNFNKFGINNS